MRLTPYTEFYYYRGGQLQAVRSGKWKLHVPHRYPTLEGGEPGRDGSIGRYAQGEIGVALFDLETDPAETRDVGPTHPDVVDRLLALVDTARANIGDVLTESVGLHARPAGFVEEPWRVQVER